MQKLSITWLGHSTFIVRTPGGKRVLFDPWLTSNPSCPDSLKKPPKVDLILVSHGHYDHLDPASLRMLPASPRIVVPRASLA